MDGETGPKNSGLGIWTTASYEAINSDILKVGKITVCYL